MMIVATLRFPTFYTCTRIASILHTGEYTTYNKVRTFCWRKCEGLC